MNELFEVERFCVVIKKDGNGPVAVEATIKVVVDGQAKMAAAESRGPISALNKAISLALRDFYPGLKTTIVSDDGWPNAIGNSFGNLAESYREQIQSLKETAPELEHA